MEDAADGPIQGIVQGLVDEVASNRSTHVRVHVDIDTNILIAMWCLFKTQYFGGRLVDSCPRTAMFHGSLSHTRVYAYRRRLNVPCAAPGNVGPADPISDYSHSLTGLC
jgi:hypothetical protein